MIFFQAVKTGPNTEAQTFTFVYNTLLIIVLCYPSLYSSNVFCLKFTCIFNSFLEFLLNSAFVNNFGFWVLKSHWTFTKLKKKSFNLLFFSVPPPPPPRLCLCSSRCDLYLLILGTTWIQFWQVFLASLSEEYHQFKAHLSCLAIWCRRVTSGNSPSLFKSKL